MTELVRGCGQLLILSLIEQQPKKPLLNDAFNAKSVTSKLCHLLQYEFLNFSLT